MKRPEPSIYIICDENYADVAKVGMSTNVDQRLITIRGSLPWPKLYIHRRYPVIGSRMAAIEARIHNSLPFKRLKYGSNRDSEWYQVDDQLELFTHYVEDIINKELHLETILLQAGPDPCRFTYRTGELLTVREIDELMMACKRYDVYKRLWLSQVPCFGECLESGFPFCLCNRQAYRHSSFIIETFDYEEMHDKDAIEYDWNTCSSLDSL